jgi:hypothetical protein
VVDLADRTFRRGGFGLQRNLPEEIGRENGNDLSSYCTMRVLAAMRITLLFGTRGTLMLFHLPRTPNKPCMLAKAEERLRNEDQDRAKARYQKSTCRKRYHAVLVSRVTSPVKRARG